MNAPTHIAVTLRQRSAVVDARLVAVGAEVALGEAPGAAVPFPGRTLTVRREGGVLRLDGERLEPGRPAVVDVGDAVVTVEAVVESPAPRALDHLPDLRPAVVTAAILLLALSLEAAHRVLDRNAELARHLEALVLGAPALHDTPAAPAPRPLEPHPWPPVVELAIDEGR